MKRKKFRKCQKFSRCRVKTALYEMKRKNFFKIHRKVFNFKNYRKLKKLKNIYIRIGPNRAIWTHHSRTRFFPDMRFSLNVQEQYALSFKTHFTSDITVRFFTKVQKPHFGFKLSHFWPKTAKPDFFGQNGLRHF